MDYLWPTNWRQGFLSFFLIFSCAVISLRIVNSMLIHYKQKQIAWSWIDFFHRRDIGEWVWLSSIKQCELCMSPLYRTLWLAASQHRTRRASVRNIGNSGLSRVGVKGERVRCVWYCLLFRIDGAPAIHSGTTYIYNTQSGSFLKCRVLVGGARRRKKY